MTGNKTDAEWLAHFGADANPCKAATAAAIAAGDDRAIADLHNARDLLGDHALPWELKSAAMVKLAGGTRLRAAIEDGCSPANPDLDARSFCLALRDLLGGTIPLDLTDGAITDPGGKLDILIAAAYEDAPSRAVIRAAVLAAGSVPTSEADRFAGYPTVLTTDDVARILRGV